MSEMRKRVAAGLAVVAACLALAAVPLLGCRDEALSERPWMLCPLAACAALAAAACRRGRSTGVPTPQPPGKPSLREWGLMLLLLGGALWVCFWQPMRTQFWGGFDEVVLIWNRDALNVQFPDRWLGRPLWFWPAPVGGALAPRTIEGWLWLCAGLGLANGLLLYSLLRRFFPQAPWVGATASLLLVVNFAEPTRFLVMWTTVFYWGLVFWLLLAFRLLVAALDRSSHGLFLLASLCLAVALLNNEAAFPLSLAGLVLLAWRRKDCPVPWVWQCAWAGVLGLLALRFGTYLIEKGNDGYQGQQMAQVLGEPAILLGRLGAHFRAMLGQIDPSPLGSPSWRQLLLAPCFGLVLWMLTRQTAWAAPERRTSVLLLLVALPLWLLATLPFLPLNTLWRGLFLSAPAQALALTGLLALGLALVPARLRTGAMCVLTSLAAVNAVEAGRCGERKLPYVSFEKTVHVFEQLHGIAPQFKPDTLVVLVPDEPGSYIAGATYHCGTLALRTLGCYICYAEGDPLPTHRLAWDRHGCRAARIQPCGFETLAAFRVMADGSLVLLEKLPPGLLPEGAEVEKYRPLDRFCPGEFHRLPSLRYLSWMKRPIDVVDARAGIGLSGGWGPLEQDDSGVFRWANNGAQLIVNSRGQSERELSLRLQVPAAGTCRLELRDDSGSVRCAAEVKGRETVPLRFATDPGRVELLSLHVMSANGSGSTPPFFQVFLPGDVVPLDRQLLPSGDIIRTGEGLGLGRNWFECQLGPDGPARFCGNDAELLVGPGLGERVLLLDLRTCGKARRVQLVGPAGKVLAERYVGGRTQWRVPLPSCYPPGTVLRLHLLEETRRPGYAFEVWSFRVDCRADL